MRVLTDSGVSLGKSGVLKLPAYILSEKPADSTFQSPKICGKKCVNFDGKVLRQKCVNYKNHKNLVSMWHFADSIVCFNVFIDYLLQ